MTFPHKPNDLSHENETCFLLNMLEVLHMMEVNLKTSKLFDLSNLVSIDLSYNQLTAFPTELSNCPSLQIVSLAHNNLGSGNNLQVPRSVKRLDLTYNQLTHFPISLTKLSMLSYLSVSHNQLSDLPETMAGVPTIVELLLDNNKLTTLPSWISELSICSKLSLANNPLGDLLDLKQDIGLKSRRLKYLDLSNLSMNNMPNSLCKLLDLRHLNISNNKTYSWYMAYCSNNLPYLPTEFTRLVGLVKLIAVGVKLSELPDDIHHMRNLEIIDISKNNLRWLPPSIHLLPKLRIMNISNNNIDMLPLYLEELQSLEHIIASHNRISELPEKLGVNSNLLTLDMYDNRLYQVQDMRLNTGLVRCDFAMNYINMESLEKDMINKYHWKEARLRSWNENLGEGYTVNMCNLDKRESTQRLEEYNNNAALMGGGGSYSDCLNGGINSETTESCKSDSDIFSYTTAEETTVNSVGETNEESGQSDEETTVNSVGESNEESGQSDEETTVNSVGETNEESGQSDEETTVNSVGELNEESGQSDEENTVNSVGESNEESGQSDEWTIEADSFDLPAKISFRHNLERMDLELYWGKDQFCPADQHASPRNKKILQYWEDQRLIRADRVGWKATHNALCVQRTYDEPIQGQFEDAELAHHFSM